MPKTIVSDGGGIFYCNQAMQVYQALEIEKLRMLTNGSTSPGACLQRWASL
ncbi:hypothetical protein [Ktedonobacter racemifer]|uniref:hypothetical protein n=1 Tax=Ktedonobacter racemifer TaxID=363277 RepID=UPI0002DAB90A|nr:hypothetical protein [Ktedonobacter racemifer]